MDGARWLRVLLVVTLARRAEGQACASNRTLERYLAGIALELPDVAFAAYTFEGEVGALRCSRLAVGSIASTRPAVGGADGSATLVLSGLSIACTGDYAFRQTFSRSAWLHGASQCKRWGPHRGGVARAETQGSSGSARSEWFQAPP